MKREIRELLKSIDKLNVTAERLKMRLQEMQIEEWDYIRLVVKEQFFRACVENINLPARAICILIRGEFNVNINAMHVRRILNDRGFKESYGVSTVFCDYRYDNPDTKLRYRGLCYEFNVRSILTAEELQDFERI